MDTLNSLVQDFAVGFKLADARNPEALNARTKQQFRPGIGPHCESDTIKLIMNELVLINPTEYSQRFVTSVAYPESARRKCDLCLGIAPNWEWSIEVKMIRLLGDNGKLNDNIIMHILSPYPEHRSALTDCQKLARSIISGKKALLIYGYDYDGWPLDPLINAFETLASSIVVLGERFTSSFKDLVHPVHQRGRVFAWEIMS